MTAVTDRAAVPGSATTTPGPRRRGGVVRSYLALTKPRIVELLLVTTVPTMMLAVQGLPPAGLLLATLVGGSLAAGSANALNCYVDRDIDRLMVRTARRPLPQHQVTPRATLVFGLALGVLATVWLTVFTNVLSAVLGVVAIAFYVLVYTLLLKRRTAQNIVWGGAAGCMPVFIGWSAATGTIGWSAVVLFGVVFLWTPPHYWPLAMRFRDDYAAAGVPMLPVVATPVAVARQILAYSYAMVAVSLLLWPVAGTTLLYPLAAVVLGAVFLLDAHGLHRRATAGAADLKPMRLFHLSISYLSLLFVVVAVDALLQ